MLLILTSGTSAWAQAPAPKTRSLQSSGRYVFTTVGFWNMHEEPDSSRKPTFADLTRADARTTALDFGLSFNCAIARSGGMSDCRAIYASTDTADKAALVKALAPLFRLDPASIALARDKAYRLTIDVALDTIGSFGTPKECRPSFCMIEGARPPPPPPLIRDPVLSAAVARARTCFDAAWQRSTMLRFAAEKALAERSTANATNEDRRQALEYVRSRHVIAACIADLRATARVLPIDGADKAAVGNALDAMKMNYKGQKRYELAVLIGLLDPNAAKVEATIP